MTQYRITDNLPSLLAVLPKDYANAVKTANQADDLLEIVVDPGSARLNLLLIENRNPIDGRTLFEIPCLVTHR